MKLFYEVQVNSEELSNQYKELLCSVEHTRSHKTTHKKPSLEIVSKASAIAAIN